MKSDHRVIIFAHSIEPNGISGSETILIEIFKRLETYFTEIVLYTWSPGKDMYSKLGLTNVKFKISRIPVRSNFYISFISRVIYGIFLGLSIIIKNPGKTYIYPGSDFWPDSIPAILTKIRYPTTKLIATFFLTAPNPFFGFKENNRSVKPPTIRGLFYWLMQQPVFALYQKLAHAVVVTSQPDKQKFNKASVFVVRGGVDSESIKKFQENHPDLTKKYDCVFMGRFHSQKGVLELIDIWSEVQRSRHGLQLCMIGDGPLFNEVKHKIFTHGLQTTVTLTGAILNAEEKFAIFNRSRIALHPALYDSGGMAVAEIMAFGLPGIAFDLEALQTYYPKGFIKVPIGDLQEFAHAIITLLGDSDKYQILRHEAIDMIKLNWDWAERAREFASFLSTNEE